MSTSQSEALLFVFLCLPACAQTPAELPKFEAASVKLADMRPPITTAANPGLPVGMALRLGGPPGRLEGGPGTEQPGQIECFRCPLLPLMRTAYEVAASQVRWRNELDFALYDIVAKVPPGSTRHDTNLMLQQLLIERFHLAYHRETKPDTVYALVAGKHGPQLHPNEPTPGRIPYPTIGGNSLFTLTGSGKSMKQLADAITPFVDLPVVDATGLKGEYDFSLVWLANIGLSHPKKKDLPPGVHKLAKRVEDALKQQLGLKLVTRRMPVEFLIVDSLLRVPVEP